MKHPKHSIIFRGGLSDTPICIDDHHQANITSDMFGPWSLDIAGYSCELCNFSHVWMVGPRRTIYQKPWALRSWEANRRS
jgi:hypothetical protein